MRLTSPTLTSAIRAGALAAALALGLSACGGSSSSSSSAVAPPATPSSATPTTASSPGTAGATQTLVLNVVESASSLAFDKSTLTADPGTVTIELKNGTGDQMPHAIAIEGKGTDAKGEVVQPGGDSQVTADLKPGMYTYYCPVGHHEQAGIGAVFRRAAESVEAPESPRRRIESDRARRPARRPGRRHLAIGVATVALGGVTGAVWVAERGSSPPSMDTVAAAALAPTSGRAPGPDPGDGEYLTAHVDGVRFPSYAGLPNWEVVGSRSERLSGRDAVTVAYTAEGVKIGYTVVDGAALAVPADATRVRAAGVEAAILPVSRGSAVTWRARGHTCVLASPSAPAARLLLLIPAPA